MRRHLLLFPPRPRLLRVLLGAEEAALLSPLHRRAARGRNPTAATPFTTPCMTRRSLHSLLRPAQPLHRDAPLLSTLSVRWAGTSFMDTLTIDLDPDKTKADAQNRRKRHKRRKRPSDDAGDTAGEAGGDGSAAEGRGAFLRRFSALLDKCEAAVTPMVALNPGMEVMRHRGGGGEEEEEEGSCGGGGGPSEGDFLQVLLGSTAAETVVGGGDRGALLLTAEADTDVVTVRLPVSGTLRYSFDERHGRWLNADDGHDLEGIVVRDLLRQCRGFPAF